MFDTPMRAILRTCLQLIEKEQVEERKMINGLCIALCIVAFNAKIPLSDLLLELAYIHRKIKEERGVENEV